MAVSLYRVTSPSLPSLQVGSLIIDRGEETPRMWHLYSETTGDLTPGFAGVQVGRICPACWAMGHPGTLIHGGPHGSHISAVHPDDAGGQS